jgi:hypothetical protein
MPTHHDWKRTQTNDGKIMDAKSLVLSQFPDAYIYRTKPNVDVRRPRTKDDPPALVHYVLLSGYHVTDQQAWDEAARRLVPRDLQDKPWAWEMYVALKKKNETQRPH